MPVGVLHDYYVDQPLSHDFPEWKECRLGTAEQVLAIPAGTDAKAFVDRVHSVLTGQW